MPVAVSQSELLSDALEQFTRTLDAVESGDVKALHRARVASRRLREIVPVVELDQETGKKLGRRLRRVTARLGAVRELDVLLILIDELHESRPTLSAALQRVSVDVAHARDEGRKRLVEQGTVTEMRRVADKLAKVARARAAAGKRKRSRDHAAAWRWAIAARIASRSGHLAEAIHSAGQVYLPERLHAVRIALKKLRYALELSATLQGEKRSEALRQLKRGQDTLGRMHDLQVLMDRVREVQASLTPPNLATWRALDGLVDALEDDCRRLHARYVRQRAALESLAETLAARPAALTEGRKAG